MNAMWNNIDIMHQILLGKSCLIRVKKEFSHKDMEPSCIKPVTCLDTVNLLPITDKV